MLSASQWRQMYSGDVERWYLNFDKYILYFAEAARCTICIAEYSWTRPNVRPKLHVTIAERLHQALPDE